MSKWSSVGQIDAHFGNANSDGNENDNVEEEESSDAGTSTMSFWSRESLGEQPLTWRMDPDASFSDWMVEVRVTGRSGYDTYHVHRTVLGIGPHRSGYFASTFQVQVGGYGTRLHLDRQSAKYFPTLLDYLYRDSEFSISTQNAVALGHLAQFLQIPALRRDVETFIENDLTLGTAGVYMAKAFHFHNETLSEKAKKKCFEEAVEKYSMSPRQSLQLALPWAESMVESIQKQPIWDFLSGMPGKK